jgi:hypothetical protein
MRLTTVRPLVLAIASAVLLAGCGGSGDGSEGATTTKSDTSTSESTTGDAKGDVSGTGYAYDVPEGWEVPKQEIPGTEQTNSFAADLTDADGFADNVNVIRLDPAPISDLDQLEKALVAELQGAGSQEPTIRDRFEIAGDEAVHIASFREQDGGKYLAEQYNAIHHGVSYVVTFSFSDTVDEAERDKIAESVLSTWTWTS